MQTVSLGEVKYFLSVRTTSGVPGNVAATLKGQSCCYRTLAQERTVEAVCERGLNL